MTFQSSTSTGTAANSSDRISSLLSEIITNSENFNRCIENDKFLSLILNHKLQEIFQQHILAIDLLFYDKSNADGLEEADGNQCLKVYHDLSGE